MSYARNYCVARGTATTSGGTAAYSVPHGYNLILKSMAFWPVATPPGTLLAAVFPPDGVSYVAIYNATLSESTPNLWSNWLVLNATDQLVLYAGGSNCRYWISGALLEAGPLPVAADAVLAAPVGPPPHHGPPGADPQRVSLV